MKNIEFLQDTTLIIDKKEIKVKKWDVLPACVVLHIWPHTNITDKPCTMYKEFDKSVSVSNQNSVDEWTQASIDDLLDEDWDNEVEQLEDETEQVEHKRKYTKKK
jgi:hypothetical protein